MREGRCFDPALCVAENGFAMDFLEFLFSLFEALELIERGRSENPGSVRGSSSIQPIAALIIRILWH